MGKVSFPKHASQGRRLLRTSTEHRRAPAAGMRRGSSRSPAPAQISGGPRHCKDWNAPNRPVLHLHQTGEEKPSGRALMGVGQEQGLAPAPAFLAELQVHWL